MNADPSLHTAQPLNSGSVLTPNRAGLIIGGLLASIYVITMAPGVTFWDAGEFIAAAHVLGIPHPPGTPLFVMLGRVWTMLLGDVMGVARAMNLMSALATAVAGGLSAWMVARETRKANGAAWGALAGSLCAGLGLSAWANATETEVYAASLLLVVLMLACAHVTARSEESRAVRWLVATAYVMLLAPALHLSALVGAPAAIVLVSRDRVDRWRPDRVLPLAGALFLSAGIGTTSVPLLLSGVILVLSPLAIARSEGARRQLGVALGILTLAVVAASVLILMLVRAQFDPAINQGNPHTFGTLLDVIARRQYEVAPFWPRQAPVWIQVANLAQYADWQFAFTWGEGIFTTSWRVSMTATFALFAVYGWRALRRDAARFASALLVLAICGSLGVVAYLNLKAGASIGYGFVPAGAHEARERDYFFVLGFWSWALFAGYGALHAVRARRLPAPAALWIALIPLVGNWAAVDRPRVSGATAARDVALALLASAPRNALLFVGGDNDTYPVWYLQHVEGVRPDVMPVTVPLLPADWYVAEVSRRSGLEWPTSAHIPGARWQHEERAALIAMAARRAGRPVAASAAVSAAMRALLGSGWALSGSVYVAESPPDGTSQPPSLERARDGDTTGLVRPRVGRRPQLPDDVSEMMLAIANCRRLASMTSASAIARDSLEVRCNLR